jgi:hypothetical protein
MSAYIRNRSGRPRQVALLFERSSEGEQLVAVYLDPNNAKVEADERNREGRSAALEAAEAELAAARAELAEQPYSEQEIAALDAAQIANFASDPEISAAADGIVGGLAPGIRPTHDRREHIAALEERIEILSDEERYLRSPGEGTFYVRFGPTVDAEMTARFSTTTRLCQMLTLIVEGRLAGLYRRPGPAFGAAERINRAAFEELIAPARTKVEAELAALDPEHFTPGQRAYYECWQRSLERLDPEPAAQVATALAIFRSDDRLPAARLARLAAAQLSLTAFGSFEAFCASEVAHASIRRISVSDMAQEDLTGYSPEAERRMERRRAFAETEKERNNEAWKRDRLAAIRAIKNMKAAQERNDQIAALQYEMIRRDHDAAGNMRAVNERSIDLSVRAEGLKESLLDIGDLTDDPSIHAVIRDAVGYASRSEER